jgi:hypothetical protein
MLCGWDPLTQRSYEHRKVWLQERLVFLDSVMAIDLEGFCTMGNHLHLIVRNRPDVAGKWSAEEIARKWLQLCPPYKPGTREVAETPSQADLDAILKTPARVEQLRLRLSNPSWLMRFLTEKLARVANREDRTTGRFWEGRFKMQRLLDEWAVAACLVSVDLNPIRAGMTNLSPRAVAPPPASVIPTGLNLVWVRNPGKPRSVATPGQDQQVLQAWFELSCLTLFRAGFRFSAGVRCRGKTRSSHGNTAPAACGGLQDLPVEDAIAHTQVRVPTVPEVTNHWPPWLSSGGMRVLCGYSFILSRSPPTIATVAIAPASGRMNCRSGVMLSQGVTWKL